MKLFEANVLGGKTLRNRMVMAQMNRFCENVNGVVGA